MKVLFIYNPVSGHRNIKRKVKYVTKHLAPYYDRFDVVASLSTNHFRQTIYQASSRYDLLLISGGDGTINMAINIIARLEHRPVLGFIPLGTINDAVKNFGNPTRFKKAVNLIKDSYVKDVDIIKVNNRYVSYVSCCGAFSDIPYSTSVRAKKLFGKLSYYFKAIPRFFKKQEVHGYIIANDKRKMFRSSFLLILNGSMMGGFKINKGGSNDDGYVDILFTNPGHFNSVFKYFFRKKSITRIRAKSGSIMVNSNVIWDFDGEVGSKGRLNFEVLPKYLSILTVKED